MRVHLTFVFEGDDAEDAGPATIANVNQRVPCHAALVEWARGELANNMPRVRMGSIKWSDDAARRQREKAWIEAGPVKTPPSTLWSTDGSAEAASMQGCTVTFWDPVAFFNADLSDTRVQCPKCHGTKVIAARHVTQFLSGGCTCRLMHFHRPYPLQITATSWDSRFISFRCAVKSSV